MDVTEAVANGYIKPTSELRMNSEDYARGKFQKDSLGHVMSQKRVGVIEERAAYAIYMVLRAGF